ncbi:MAG: hypothetical protein VR65_04335 [Desulfobulbaceae bacterium BRH_c16a]|nr:MAG: hypothetical protein VR65_04335 [Desulfobulbaceae bacterium BRH_c16a]
MDKGNDIIDILVNEAHEIFNKTSIYEVIDLNNGSARDFLNETYGNPEAELVERYLGVIEKLEKLQYEGFCRS